MLYCVSQAEYPVEYLSSGNLISEDGFIHERRNIDSWVFIVVCKGTLHITQNERNYDVHENESIVLFPGLTHYGNKCSEGYLSYYWVHFYITDPDYVIYNRKSLLRYNNYLYDDASAPPKILRSHRITSLSFRNTAASLLRNALPCCLHSFWICRNAITICVPGAAVMH